MNTLLKKHIEIPGCRSCLVAPNLAVLRDLGFVDMSNCVLTSPDEVVDKLDILFDDPDRLQQIIDAGYDLVHKHHTPDQRSQIYDWLKLSRSIKPGQRIVQPSLTEPLRIVDDDTRAHNYRSDDSGSDQEMLNIGDEMAARGEYGEATKQYKTMYNLVSYAPESSLRMARCLLFMGKPKLAVDLAVWSHIWRKDKYKTTSFLDPVELAHLLLAMIINENVSNAVAIYKREQYDCVGQHTELNRVIWLLKLAGESAIDDDLQEEKGLERLKESEDGLSHSVHDLPRKSFEEWRRDIAAMCSACARYDLAEIINQTLVSEETLNGKSSQ